MTLYINLNHLSILKHENEPCNTKLTTKILTIYYFILFLKNVLLVKYTIVNNPYILFYKLHYVFNLPNVYMIPKI